MKRKMRQKLKKAASLLLVLASLAALGTTTACNSTSQTKEESKTTSETSAAYKFTDALGREVSVDKTDRVVVLLGSFCDEWLLAGGNVVGAVSDSFNSLDYSLDSSVLDVGGHMEPDIEKIISLAPDFVIATAAMDAQVGYKDTFEKAGITVAYFDVDDFNDYLASFKIMTDITKRADLYEQYGLKVEEQIKNAKTKIDGTKPRILFIRAASSSVKVKGSEGTVGGEILADLGCINIADSNSKFEDLSIEAIVAEDPDYIFVTTQGSEKGGLANMDKLLTSNPAWSSLSAVKNSRYYVLDKNLYNSKPNEKWGEAYEKLVDILYKH